MNDTTALVHEDLTGLIRQTAFEVHEYFGNGFLEKVYRNALAHRLRKRNLPVCAKVEVKVHDQDGTIAGASRSSSAQDW